MAVYRYETLTAEEIKQFGASGKAVAILNLGSIEQHGPHLPVGTDCIIGAGYLDRALEKVSAPVDYLLLPMMPFSCSVEHIKFPGTITLTPEFVIRFIHMVGKSLMNSGIRKLVITSGHGGNEHVMEIAARELRVDGMDTFCIQQFLAQESHGAPGEEVHAGGVETSVLLSMDQGYVRTGKIKPECAASADKWNSMVNGKTCATQAWTADDIGVDGVCGDPSKASREEGSRWMEIMSDEIAKALDMIAESK